MPFWKYNRNRRTEKPSSKLATTTSVPQYRSLNTNHNVI